MSIREIMRAADHEGCKYLGVMHKVLGVRCDAVECFIASGSAESPIAPATAMRLLLVDNDDSCELSVRISRREDAMRILMRPDCFLELPVSSVLIMVLGSIRYCGTWPMRIFVAAGVPVAPDDLNEYMVPGRRDGNDSREPASLRDVLNISEALAMLRTIVPLPTEQGNLLADGDPAAVCDWNCNVPQSWEFADYSESMRAAVNAQTRRRMVRSGHVNLTPLDVNAYSRRFAHNLRRERDFPSDDAHEDARGAERARFHQ